MRDGFGRRPTWARKQRWVGLPGTVMSVIVQFSRTTASHSSKGPVLVAFMQQPASLGTPHSTSDQSLLGLAGTVGNTPRRVQVVAATLFERSCYVPATHRDGAVSPRSRSAFLLLFQKKACRSRLERPDYHSSYDRRSSIFGNTVSAWGKGKKARMSHFILCFRRAY